MPYFKDAEEVYANLGRLFEDIIADDELRAALPGRRHRLPVPDAPARLAGHRQGARGRRAAGRVRHHRAAARDRPGHGRRHRRTASGWARSTSPWRWRAGRSARAGRWRRSSSSCRWSSPCRRATSAQLEAAGRADLARAPDRRPFPPRAAGVARGHEAPRPRHRSRRRRRRALGAARRRPRRRRGARRLARRQRVARGLLGLGLRRGDRRRRVGRRAARRRPARARRADARRRPARASRCSRCRTRWRPTRPTACSSSCATRTARATARTTSSARRERRFGVPVTEIAPLTRQAQRLLRVVARAPVQQAPRLAGVHEHRAGAAPRSTSPPRAGRAGGRRARRSPRRPASGIGTRAVAERVGEVAHRDLARAREVVGARLAAAEHAGAQRGRDVVVVDELEGHARVGEDADGAGQRGRAAPGSAIGPARLVDQRRRVGPGDDARPEDPRARSRRRLSASSRTSSTSALWAE